MDLTFEEVVEAYFQCRKGKRRSVHALDFEFDLERNLFQLYYELMSGSYRIGKSVAFVIDQPKIREASHTQLSLSRRIKNKRI